MQQLELPRGAMTLQPRNDVQNLHRPSLALSIPLRAHPLTPSRTRSLVRQYRHVRKLTILIVVIQPVADHEAVGNIEAAVIRFDSHLLPALFAEEHARPHRRRTETTDVFDQVVQG